VKFEPLLGNVGPALGFGARLDAPKMSVSALERMGTLTNVSALR
jgi:hypothetical protein